MKSLKTYFTIAGKEGKFVPANARIDHNTLVVFSPDVAEPAAVATPGTTILKAAISTTEMAFRRHRSAQIRGNRWF
jgi:hypothetical protein